MDANPLITGLEQINITRCWVSPLVMHCFLSNWFLGHITFSFVFVTTTLPPPPSFVDEVACCWIMSDSFLFHLPMTLVLGDLCPYK